MIPTLQPDIIISDVMMPQMDGYELCRAVKNDLRTSHIPLILLTAHTTEEQKIEGLETGADDYITKPFNLEILQLRISKLIERRNQKQEAFNKQIDPSPTDITITSLDEKLITRAIEYIEKNIDRSELSVEELSRELGMSRVHLYKKLTAITGKSPVEFIRVIRLKRAAQLLRESQLNISEIAYEVGFNNPKYFSKYFKEEFGVLPSDYKTEHGK
ncbi:DNA-binding response regulator [Bacteroides reticulotermitis JCM 10512]|uniref:DNA-binding response regulator n=4 Tax=Bacteroides reticulotermitis TaxID=1133319 RepID=W4UWY4_9BACE|nr:DNA-binding response regulator [Bacteroides reticulotermitis JCM 10512]